MKKLILLLLSVFIVSHSFAQETGIIDARSYYGDDAIKPTGKPVPSAPLDGGPCSYLYDDGTSEDAIGLVSGGDIMWLSYFTASAGCEQIESISLTWGWGTGGTYPNGATCRVILYEDPTDDGDPSDAVYLTEASTVVVNANMDIFTTVPITPTLVSGGFFAAALVTIAAGEHPASIDETTSAGNSWVSGATIGGGFDVNDLTNNDVGLFLLDNIGYAGNWLLRCEGGSPPPIPLSNWAIVMGVLLMGVFIVIRFKTRLA